MITCGTSPTKEHENTIKLCLSDSLVLTLLLDEVSINVQRCSTTFDLPLHVYTIFEKEYVCKEVQVFSNRKNIYIRHYSLSSESG